MNFEWSDELRSGNVIIDFQHRLLFKFIRETMESVRAGHSIEAAEEIVQFFKVYFIEHFGDEEEIMEEVNYPKAYMHAEEHKRIKEEADKLSGLLEKSDYSASNVHEAFIFASKWLHKHFTEMDKELIDYIKDSYHGNHSP